MALFTENYLRTVGRDRATQVMKSAHTSLREGVVSFSEQQTYDVFLSHSIKDAEIILGIKVVLESQGLKVYVDWIEDANLDRSNVTAATADKLRDRMKQSRSLIYASSNNSPSSKWMPWETGYFDGLKGAVAILPVAQVEGEPFKGQEFLGLYPYIDHSNASMFINQGKAAKRRLGAVDATRDFRGLREWMRDVARVSVY